MNMRMNISLENLYLEDTHPYGLQDSTSLFRYVILTSHFQDQEVGKKGRREKEEGRREKGEEGV